MLYQLITLDCLPLTEGAVAAAARDWIAQGAGRLLGVWRSEIGDLFQVKLLRGFDTATALDEERQRALKDKAPFGVTDSRIRLRTESYMKFPFLKDIEPAVFGNFYEFRTYFLKPGGFEPTLSSWQDAMVPAGEYTAHLVINMYSLDGPPRITHIWGFSSLEERRLLRARHYAEGVWPPKGAPQQIAKATTMIYIPESYSPLN